MSTQVETKESGEVDGKPKELAASVDMNGDETVDAMFVSFREEMETENELKEKIRVIVRDLEQKARDIVLIVQKVHRPAGLAKMTEVCTKARNEFDQVRGLYNQLSQCISPQEYFKYADHYRFINQRYVYLAALLVFLDTTTMISKEEAAKMLGISANRTEKFYLDLEDYLSGLLQVAPELSRLAVNCVTVGDYDRPLKISAFLNDLDAGFRLLNLKNDSLRKRFDGLKYEVKKVEEVVYDLTIRSLLKTSGASTGETGAAGSMVENQ